MAFSEITLGSVAELVRGVSYKPSDLLPTSSQESVRLLRATNIAVGALRLDDVLHVPKHLVREHQYVRQHDVIVAMSSGSRAAVGRLAQLRSNWDGTFGAFCGVIRPLPGKIDPLFLGYLVSSPEFRARIDAHASGTAIMNLSRDHLLGFPFVPPTLSEQTAIGRLLGALDERIDNLRQTNVTLEALARTIFKSWFVDFDPVRAKAEGHEPKGMDAATAALFPSEFEEPELGPIPKGWSTRPVYGMADFVNGAAYKAFRPNLERRGLPIIKIAELKAGITGQTAYCDVDMPKKYHLDSGDILFSWSGNPDTSIDTFVWSFGPALLNQHVFNVVPAVAAERSLVLITLKYLRPRFAEIARNKQTTGLGHVTVGDLKEMRVALPPTEIVEAWSQLLDPILARILCNQYQLQSLVNLRDTLLPRLISGKLRLPEAAALVDEVSA